MFDIEHIYGLDIETDNSEGHGLNPDRAAITSIAISHGLKPYVFNTGNELTDIKSALLFLADMPAGLVVTWNGAFFDLPFIKQRMGAGVEHAPNFHTQRLLKPKYDFLPRFDAALSATFDASGGAAHHAHLDIAPAYKTFAEDRGVSWSLKPVAEAMGRTPVVLDRTRLHDYTRDEQRAYVASDAVETAWLAARLIGAL